ncbi:uncharacterized protein LOC141915011 [Tubulanus polymorphus]|uniref:uncharacterized protein LOC141915011 n=1 Tax=Tubulanus polymorphus TaxID=672921 RepID=UPI003DA1E8F3
MASLDAIIADVRVKKKNLKMISRQVRECGLDKEGGLSGFYRCDHCVCSCVKTKNAAKYTLNNMKFDMSEASLEMGQPISIARTIVSNKGIEPQRIQRTLSFTHVSETSVTNQHSLQSGLSIKVTSGISFPGPIGIDSDLSMTGTITTGFTYAVGERKAKSQTDSLMAWPDIPGKSQKEILIIGHRMQLDVPYEADLEITYEDGSTKEKHVTGVYTNVDMGQFHVYYKEAVPLSRSPADGRVIGWDINVSKPM